jgi:hypothetical protein
MALDDAQFWVALANLAMATLFWDDYRAAAGYEVIRALQETCAE